MEAERKTPTKKHGGRSMRRRSREYALQGIYEWLLNHSDAAAIDAAVLEDEQFAQADAELYRQILHGVLDDFVALEAIYAPFVDRDVKALSPVERAALLIGTYELRDTVTPYRVIINEAVELTKSFGGTDGYRYVNGVLDKVVPVLRPHEAKNSRHD